MEGMKWVCEAENPDPTQEFSKNIYIKVNSLSEIEMVKYIEELAEQHPDTTFNIICRGICSLPMRENVKIKSIVGRFLEHSSCFAIFDTDTPIVYKFLMCSFSSCVSFLVIFFKKNMSISHKLFGQCGHYLINV